MYTSNGWSILLPTALQLMQAAFVLWATVLILKKRKLLQYPIGAMEYSTAILCATIVLCTLSLSAGDAEYFFRACKSIGRTEPVFGSIMAMFSRYLLTTLCFEMGFIVLSVMLVKFLGRDKNDEKMLNGNIPMAILCSGGVIGLSVIVHALAQPMYELLTPVYFNFR